MKREFLNEPWRKIAARRRLLLMLLVLIPALAAASVMGGLLPHKGRTILESAIIIVYCVLFIWISLGFWTAMAGFWTLLKKDDRFAVTRSRGDLDAPIRPHVKTALLFPVCNEEPERIMAGIGAVWRSLVHLGAADRFDVHILSDSADPDCWVREEAAWNHLCDELQAHGRIFYRRRRINLKRKSGNVADFCRRYGGHYTYMIVFDADSVMTGETLVRMVRIMERRRNVGILQTAPACTGRETLIARAQQFANRAYGPMYAAGLHHWFLGDAQFWGHNAIIRVKPFMRHCGLARLPGKPPLGGDILSHDFVESALMRRAGYSVWLAYDLEGSYEEVPPNLLNELKRDRRWCQGNLQHLRLVFSRGIFPGHRALFLNGVMSYGSALLWFLFLALSTAEAVTEALVQPDYFTPAKSLFPIWPVWNPWPALSLLAGTALVLFLPKVCALLLTLLKGRRKQFGGFFALCGQHPGRGGALNPSGPRTHALPQQVRLPDTSGPWHRVGNAATRRPGHGLQGRPAFPRRRDSPGTGLGTGSVSHQPRLLLVDLSPDSLPVAVHSGIHAHQQGRHGPGIAPRGHLPHARGDESTPGVQGHR